MNCHSWWTGKKRASHGVSVFIVHNYRTQKTSRAMLERGQIHTKLGQLLGSGIDPHHVGTHLSCKQSLNQGQLVLILHVAIPWYAMPTAEQRAASKITCLSGVITYRTSSLLMPKAATFQPVRLIAILRMTRSCWTQA